MVRPHCSRSLFSKTNCQLLPNSLKIRIKYTLHKLPFKPHRVCYYPKSLTVLQPANSGSNNPQAFQHKAEPKSGLPKALFRFSFGWRVANSVASINMAEISAR